MCGIFGIIGKQDQEEIKAANRTISHRGPDAEGYWFDNENSVALCHRRLSILDLTEAGAQPMKSVSGRYILTYNGEIYNYLELKSKLPKVNWRGHSDTEVLLQCFEQWGLEKTFESIEGMYAMALWDSQLKILTLVRDRIGEKPLYYGEVQGRFVFASELKPIIKLFKNDLSLNTFAVEEFFKQSCIAGDRSIFKGIHKLPAGHFISLSLEDLKARKSLPSTKKYWDLQDIPLGSLQISSSEAIELLETKLRKAIAQQMVADVPIGAFLSGGIDSSVIVALMQSLSAEKIKTFSIGFESRHHNEAHHAGIVAAHLGTDHQELYVSERDLLNQIPLLPQIYDEPFADSSQIPTILVSQMARGHVKVAVSGDGGDELFAGYNRHQFAYEKWDTIRSIPMSLRRLVSKCLTMVPPSGWEAVFKAVSAKVTQPHEKIYKLAQVLKDSSLSDFYQTVSTHSSPLLKKGAVTKNWNIESALEMTLVDAKWYMPDDILVKVDRASMAQGLETRAPFLSKEVVEMAFALPMNLKIHKGKTKWILRQILYKYVPMSLMERPKMGFGVPLDSWLRNELKEWAWSLLSPQALQQQDILDSRVILKKWNEHQSGRRNWQTELWDVLMFISWRQMYKI